MERFIDRNLIIKVPIYHAGLFSGLMKQINLESPVITIKSIRSFD